MRNFDEKYMQMAYIWASNSYALRRKVGAIVVKDNQIISDGFNGTPSGFDNDCETMECTCEDSSKCYLAESDPEMRYHKVARPDGLYIPHNINKTECHRHGCPYCKLTTMPYVLHAEANAITKLAKSSQSSVGATLYVTLSPCLECSKLIIQSGITRVVYDEEYHDTTGISLLRKCGITVEKLEKKYVSNNESKES